MTVYQQLWGRIFAAGYDRFLSPAEAKSLGAVRDDLLARAKGDVVEIGAGTGANLAHYPSAVARLVVTDPDEFMVRKLRQKASLQRPDTEIVQAPGERLPFDDESFDTAVLTMVLCSVADPAVVIGEAERVLRPGGQLLFFEHVRSPDNPRLASWQDRLTPAWRRFGHGCHPNRRPERYFERSGLELTPLRRGEIDGGFPLVKPLLVAAAAKPS